MAYDSSFAGNALFMLPFAGLMVGMAPRGEKLATGAGAAAGMGVGGFLGGAVGAALAGPGGAMVGSMAGGFLLDPIIQDKVQAGVSYVAHHGRNITKLEAGAQHAAFLQTEQAYTMRQAAVREMSGSLLNSRRWLGNEGRLMAD